MHENREVSGASRSNQDRDRSAKAQSHNADMHVSEKSDCAILPMNQPNKGGSSPAEVGEGRAPAKENIVRSNTSPTQSGERVSQGLSGCAANSKGEETGTVHRSTPPYDGRSAP
jgi:RNA-directed DNA polymerase